MMHTTFCFESLEHVTYEICVFLVLRGPGIESEHCILESIEGTVTLHPIAEENCVNGKKIKKPLRLSQGKSCYLVFF